MLEVYVFVEKKKSLVMKILILLLFLVGAYFMYASLVGLIIFFALAAPLIALGWFLRGRNLEFEYSYFDGDFRFAKIFNKQKRKDLTGYEAENVIVIAPKGDRSIYKYENDKDSFRMVCKLCYGLFGISTKRILFYRLFFRISVVVFIYNRILFISYI